MSIREPDLPTPVVFPFAKVLPVNIAFQNVESAVLCLRLGLSPRLLPADEATVSSTPLLLTALPPMLVFPSVVDTPVFLRDNPWLGVAHPVGIASRDGARDIDILVIFAAVIGCGVPADIGLTVPGVVGLRG